MAEERDTIRRIRQAVRKGRLPRQFTGVQVNILLRIYWGSTFLAKHRVGNPSGYTELFIRIRRGLYRLKPKGR